MPIAANPNIKTPFTLETWRSIPEAEQPALLVKYMTVEEHQRVEQLIADARATDASQPGATEQIWDKVWQAVAVGVVGWRNFKATDGSTLEFNEVNFFAELTNRERWAVVFNYPDIVRLTPRDRKN